VTGQHGPVEKAHRLLAPRIAYLVGTRSPDGEPNLIPVSNVTSVSTDPQMLILAVLKKWQTYHNLRHATGFTVSVPTADHLDGVWKLGARYSRYRYEDRHTKLRACGLHIGDDPESPGPVLQDGIGWLTCATVAQHDIGGDHGLFIGEITHVHFNPDHLSADGTPIGNPRPLMQITGNRFTTGGDMTVIPYGPA
jgi:flavin reductase (DIM6/NTAB) family NADH-FMN oxidoreductase RutF